MKRPPAFFRGRRGIALVYTAVTLVVMLLFASLAVDLGRASLVKTELRTAVDAASRYGITGIDINASTASSRTITAAAENNVDGTALALISSDIEFGVWDPATRGFAVLTGSATNGATAMRVTGRRTSTRSTAVPTSFSRVVGLNSVDVTAQVIVTRGKIVSAAVDADACPWLAGMGIGASVDPTGGNPQRIYAPASSPFQISGIPMNAGSKLSFRQASGNTGFNGGSNIAPDGNAGWIVTQAAANGINQTSAPIASMVGIFLDDRAPNTYSQGVAGNFSSAASRDFLNLSPPLKQVFFIGDGIDSQSRLQTFTVPANATRLFIGVMDEKGWWWDNYGTINWTALDQKISLVK